MIPSVKQIVRQVLPHFGMEGTEPEALLGIDRHKSIAEARQVAMWVAREALGMSYPELGRTFMRDHTTAISACRKVERCRAVKPTSRIATASHSVLLGVTDARARDLPGLANTRPIGLEAIAMGVE